MQDKYIGLVKKFYDDKGIEQISIVEVMHMVEFVEWLEQYAAQQSVNADVMPCGHPLAESYQGADGGTYCRICESA